MRVTSTANGVIIVQRPSQGFLQLKEAGFDNVYLDFEMICPAGAMRTLGSPKFKSNFATRAIEDPTRLIECVTPVFEKAKECGLDINTVKAPTLLIDTRRADLNDLIITLTKESIKACGKFNVKNLIVDCLFAGIDEEDLLKVNKDYYLSLATFARDNNVTILLENQCRDVGGHLLRGFLSDAKIAGDFINELNTLAGMDVFGFAYNLGNANLCSINHCEFLTSTSSLLKVVLISDNDGFNEASLLPYTSTSKNGLTTDWLNFIRGVRHTDFDGDIILEYENTAAVTSAILKPPFLSYVKAVGDFFAWQLSIERLVKQPGDRVLFGAGNMCRNYILNYGEEYPPLFTCDNNSANWGKTFEGLEIKNPEELKSLPDDVMVFICNMYYREIEDQLREMGLKNPIVYFSDEYMPSFHFERLELATT